MCLELQHLVKWGALYRHVFCRQDRERRGLELLRLPDNSFSTLACAWPRTHACTWPRKRTKQRSVARHCSMHTMAACFPTLTSAFPGHITICPLPFPVHPHTAPHTPPECPDYRWSYTHRGPIPSELIAALQLLLTQQSQQYPPHHQQHGSSSQTGTSSTGSLLGLNYFYPGSFTAATPSAGGDSGGVGGVRDLGPLPPHVCSLALLPSGTQGYVPSDVRWLMEEGSPVFDLYKECLVRSGWLCCVS